MQITVKKNIGKSQLEVVCDGKDDKESIALALLFTQPDVCGLCHQTNIIWDSNKAKSDSGSFTYIKRKCLGCNATSTLGSYQDGNGYFWKQWELYQPTGTPIPLTQPAQPSTPATPATPTEEEIPMDEVPFP